MILSISGYGQIFGAEGNKKPKITGQKSLSTNEEQAIAIALTDLQVEDKDDYFYPIGFTMTIHPGDNYSISENSVTPAKDFSGTLTVSVSVNDGEDNSEVFDLKIEVININDPPVITAYQPFSSDEDKAFVIQPGQLTIVDPDDQTFSVAVGAGANYTVSGQSVTPSKEFSGTLTIPVTVSDGEATSLPFSIQVEIRSVNDPPKIVSQQNLSTQANVPLTLQLQHLTVEDPDDTYPADFSLKILSGDNYSVSGSSITPNSTFAGVLTVGVRVSDGAAESETFNLQITVARASGKPVITSQTPIIINEDESFTILPSHLKVSDSENSYPNGFTITAGIGENYTITDRTTVVPEPDFHGNLFVSVVVSKGSLISEPFAFVITLRPVNDPPRITFDSSAVMAKPSASIKLFSNVKIVDADNDSLSLAEITFNSENYLEGVDILTFNPVPGIRAVFDSQNGILALLGKASLKKYEEALSAINYEYLAATATEARPLTFVNVHVNDGQANSNNLKKTIRYSEGGAGSLEIPTAFTPNGDLVNDTWDIRPLGNTGDFQDASIRVYTKTGQMVFESQGIDKSWDGKFNGAILPADVYYYTVNFNEPDQTSVVKGVVSILR